MVNPIESRIESRKILRCAAEVLLAGATLIKGRTIDIAMSGVCVMLEGPIPLSRKCKLVFESPVGGEMIKVDVAAKAVYCTHVETVGFRVGFQFDRHNEAAAKSIRRLLE